MKRSFSRFRLSQEHPDPVINSEIFKLSQLEDTFLDIFQNLLLGAEI